MSTVSSYSGVVPLIPFVIWHVFLLARFNSKFEGVAENQCYAKYQIFRENPLLSTKQTILARVIKSHGTV